jgi:hypothetical protein
VKRAAVVVTLCPYCGERCGHELLCALWHRIACAEAARVRACLDLADEVGV